MRPYIYMSINYKFFQNARKDAEIEAVKHELTHVLRALAVAEADSKNQEERGGQLTHHLNMQKYQAVAEREAEGEALSYWCMRP
jgi:hypothetical protein